MPVRSLPANPSLRHLKLEAKALRKAALQGDSSAVVRIDPQLPSRPETIKLSDAQHALAREYGFESWRKLKIFVELRHKTFCEREDAFLQNAWAWGDRSRAEAILQAEPDLDQASFYAACVTGNHERVATELAGIPHRAHASGGPRDWAPVLYAAWSCYLNERPREISEVIRLLCKHGADANASWTNAAYGAKESALYGAVNSNCVQVARQLLAAGADPNDGESLYHACEHRNLEMLDALADHGLNTDDLSYCLKHVLDFRWHEGTLWFLDHGADPNAVHPASHETSLHWAIKRNCSRETILALLQSGADPNARTRAGHSAYPSLKGWTPCDFALRLGATDIVTLLVAHGATPTEPDDVDRFVYACTAGDSTLARAMLSQSPTLIAQLDDLDRRLISLAAQSKNWQGLRLMLDLGWPVDGQGWMDATPLTWALCYGNSDAMSDLLERGASLESRGDYFQSPLHTVLHCQWGPGDHAKCLDHLLTAGVEVPADLDATGRADVDAVLERWRQREKRE